MSKILASIALAVAAPAAMAQCITPTGTSQGLNGVVVDGWSGSIPIGFSFPFNGATYTDFYVSDHSLIALNNGGVPAAPLGGAFVWTPSVASLAAGTGPLIAPYWSDHWFNAAGEVYVDNTSGTSCTIQWIDVQTYLTGNVFSVSVTLHANGQIDFGYDDRVNNDGSSFGPLNAIAGIGDVGVSMTNAVDLTSGAAVSPAIDIFEEFVTTAVGTPNPNFDLATRQLSLFPTNPGWVVTSAQLCLPNASMSTYGMGCGSNGGGAKVIYEDLPIGGFDIANGTTVTYLRSGASYLVTTSIPGTFVAPTGAAINIAPGLLDGEQVVNLSSPMPIPGGTTTQLNICTKAYITLNGLSNGIDFTPSSPELLAFANPTIAPNWHDYDQTEPGSGLILFEEIGGTAYATWNGVYSFFGTAQPDTFQVQFERATGNITIVYQTMSGDGDPFTVGYTSGAPVTIDPGATDWSAGIPSPIEVFDSESSNLSLNGNAPQLGSTWNLTTTNVDPLSPIAITFFSDIQVNPGLPLTAIGIPAPGCSIYIGNNLGSLTGVVSGGAATVSLPIPNNPAIAGATLATQSVCLTLQNPFNLLTSNGGLGTVGN